MGKEEQEQRWAALKERLGSEDTRKALEEKVREGGRREGGREGGHLQCRLLHQV